MSDSGFPPSHLPPDLRTMMIAGDAADSSVLSAGSIYAALLGELVATLRESGALSDAAVLGLAERWQTMLNEMPGSPGFKRMATILAADLGAELAWQMPGVAPPAASLPTRVGRKSRPPARGRKKE